MARPLFEQYKEALRRGHVALLGGELDDALAAYREAAGLVSDRPLPYSSMGAVLVRLGRPAEALAEYEHALELTPEDASVREARDALLVDMPATVAVSEAASVAPPEPAGVPESVARSPHLDAPEEPQPPQRPAGSPGAGSVEWPAVDLPSLPAPPLAGPVSPAILQAEADAFVDAGDPSAARDPLLLAIAVHRDAGRLDAALDTCLQLLAIAPGDPRVHLAIANLQLDRGWRTIATEKIELLLRLTSLSGDAQAEADVHLLAADRLRDESPARLDARRRGAPAS